MLTMPRFRPKWAILVHNDFVVYTKKGMSIERIAFDRGYWVELQGKLCHYYFKHFIKYAAAEFAPPCTEAVVVCHSSTAS